MNKLANSECSEMSFVLPWGIVAGKAWGDVNGYICLVLHGLMDNCGSFDCLIPLLPSGFRYICLDLPGHGKSSPFPSGVPLKLIDYMLSLKLVVKQLNLEEFILIGHSFGAQICSMFTATYPELVKRLILLDGIVPETTIESKSALDYRRKLDDMTDHLAKVKGKEAPVYTYEEAFHRTLTNRHSRLTEDAARIMLKRSLVPHKNGYFFSTDQRLKLHWRPLLSPNQAISFISKIRCPVLLILAKETYDRFAPIYGEDFTDRLDYLLYQSSNIITCVTVNGNHDVHLNHADRVAPHINSFLTNQVSKL